MSDEEKKILANYVPNYGIVCQVCGQKPTVKVVEIKSGFVTETKLCGACCFGEAACIDPDNW